MATSKAHETSHTHHFGQTEPPHQHQRYPQLKQAMDLSISIPTSLKGLVYSKPNLKDHTLDDIDLERFCPLDIGRHCLEPKTDLGLLDSLPLEILSDILIQLPVRSLMEFRRINQRAMQVIEFIPQFQTTTRYALSTLRGILSIQLGAHVTWQDLFHAITSTKCEACDDFAGYIYLLDCSRVCFLCFTENDRYLLLSAAEVLRTYGFNRGFLSSLVSMKSVPGCYSPNEKTCPARLKLFDPESARRAGITLYGSAIALERHVVQAAAKKFESRRLRVPSGTQAMLATTPLGGPPRLSFAKHFMAIVRTPTVNVLTDSVEWGFHCVGCKRQYLQRPMHWRRKFDIDTFEQHVRESGPMVDGAHISSFK